ncbi:coth protein-domain-containing protein [Halteromyces radiatus]|uniref:coth protein-domain-containing protein n=1 Tax=Halteromyces radiatus TaxID=101107 RepID=UPI00221E3A41|nr:coth protein-domain-containing protein [Halteromyces radiatus]KAI8086154.1 coth protein-domain-containing protein [Halteromyces radiatus]
MVEPGTQNIIASEPFERTLSNGQTTLNEFYGRQTTVQDIKTFPTATDVNVFPTGFDRAPNKLHRFNEIVTFHIQAPPDQVKHMHDQVMEDITVKSTITYISSDKVKEFSNCSFSVGGRSSKRFTKLPYKFKLDGKEHLGGYSKFKLRASTSDPSFVREKIATDLYYAVGRPTTLVSYARVIINDQGIGLFLLEEAYNDRWLQMEFNHGEKGYDNGVLYKTLGAQVQDKEYADLSYRADDWDYYNIVYQMEERSKVEDNGIQDLVSFTEFIDEQLQWQESQDDSSDLDASVALWQEQLNVKGFLANMALEFLLGSWDGYIQNAQNYYLYRQPNDGEMDWIAWDFDYVLGSGPVKMDTLLEGDYHNFTGISTRPLTKAIFRIPTFQQWFEDQVKYINNQLFTPQVSFPVIDNWVTFLKQDVLWDQSLPRVRTGKNFNNLMGGSSDDGNDKDSDKMSMPLNFDAGTALDFIHRINSNITIDNAINGPTNYKSLLAIKDFIKQKVDNVNNALKSS